MKYLGVLIFLTTSFNSWADQTKDIAVCASEKSDAMRLVCFDSLATKLGVDKVKSKALPSKSKWHVREDRSPIDDSVNITMSLASNDKVRSGYKNVQPRLFVRCSENKTNVFITWNLYLGLDKTQMLTRFDKQKATTSTWSLSTDNKAVFVRGGDIDFAKKLIQHKKLLTQITPYNESPVMATFDLSGLGEDIKPLRKACGW